MRRVWLAGICAASVIAACGVDENGAALLDGGFDAGHFDGGHLDSGDDSTVGDSGVDGGIDAGHDAQPSDSGQDATRDGGGDSGADGGVDSGLDAGRDAGVDAGVDSGADAGVDAAVDSGIDSGVDAGVDSGVDAGIDSGVDAGTVVDASLDAPLIFDGGMCNNLANGGPSVPEVQIAANGPTTGAGGTIALGLYYFTKWEVYTGPNGNSGPTGNTRKAGFFFEATTYQKVTADNGGQNENDNRTWTTVGTELDSIQDCPTPDTLSSDYTATPTTLVLIAGGNVLTFTKQ